jgi:hypothetical protein
MSIGHNGVDTVALKRWTGEIMKVYQRLDEQRMENMRVCKEIREPLSDLYDAAANAGLGKKPFKSHIKAELAKLKYERALAKAVPEDDEDREAYEALRSIAEAGDLFDAAVKAHDDDADVRPRHLREQEADRIARANAAKIEKGIKPLVGLPGADASEA